MKYDTKGFSAVSVVPPCIKYRGGTMLAATGSRDLTQQNNFSERQRIRSY